MRLTPYLAIIGTLLLIVIFVCQRMNPRMNTFEIFFLFCCEVASSFVFDWVMSSVDGKAWNKCNTVTRANNKREIKTLTYPTKRAQRTGTVHNKWTFKQMLFAFYANSQIWVIEKKGVSFPFILISFLFLFLFGFFEGLIVCVRRVREETTVERDSYLSV